ncbi:hypothetical protein [Aquimarina algiphila]|uniref:hypothetical protein n=1 Tax=Aquimarina algiphila TaxID=2047982 RepID=UPI002330DDF8|nr:hypothetical protein [Aquimarina algiphila]
MSLDKLSYIKKVIEKKLSDFDFDGEIKKFEEQQTKIINTPADEYSFSGNIEHGIRNILEVVTGTGHPIGYLTAQKNTFKEILELLEKEETELKAMLSPKSKRKDKHTKSVIDKIFSEAKNNPPKKHFFDCKLTDEEWGSENCICPGAYIYRKYRSIGLSEEEARLIFTYCEIGDIMGEDYDKAKALYEKHRFLKINVPK